MHGRCAEGVLWARRGRASDGGKAGVTLRGALSGLSKLLHDARKKGARKDGGDARPFAKTSFSFRCEPDAVEHGQIRLRIACRIGGAVEGCGKGIVFVVRIGRVYAHIINGMEPLGARLLDLRRIGNYDGQSAWSDGAYGA